MPATAYEARCPRQRHARMRVRLQTANGREIFSIEADPLWARDDIFAEVAGLDAVVDSVPQWRRRVCYEGRTMSATASLRDMGVTHGDVLTLVLLPTYHMVTFGSGFHRSVPDTRALVWAWSELGPERRVTLSHGGQVRAAFFAPDGQRICTIDGYNAMVWSTATGELVATVHGHAGGVNHHGRGVLLNAEFAKDKRHLITCGSDRTAIIWRLPCSGSRTPGATEVRTLRGHTSVLISAACSPAKNLDIILTAAEDRTAKLWSATQSRCLCTLRHGDQIYNAMFSSDGASVLTASDDMTACIWDVESGTRVRCFHHDTAVEHAAFSPNGQRALTVGSNACVRVWSVSSGVCLYSLRRHMHRRWVEVNCAVFSPSGNKILTVSSDGVGLHGAIIWSALSGECLLTLRLDDIGAGGAFSPDELEVLTSTLHGTTTVWCPESGECWCTFCGASGASFAPVPASLT